MTGAMYAAISGLKAHMNKLNVIGNNIANVNTYGYKTQRAIFSDSIYTTMSSGSDGTQTAGAVNPSQIGYGVEMSSVDLDMSSGTFSPTGIDMDCMIMGDGFFLVGDKDTRDFIKANDPSSLTTLTLTRVGNFKFKADGYLSDANGNVVYGFLCTGVGLDGTVMFSDQLMPISLPKLVTTTVDATDANGNPIKKTVISVGYPAAGQDGTGPINAATGENGKELPFLGMDSIAIDPVTGMITGTSKDTGGAVTIGVIALGNVTNPNGVTHTSGPYYKANEGAGDLQISLMGGVASEMRICNTVDSATTTYENTAAFTHVNQSLYTAGAGGTGGTGGTGATGDTTQPDGMRIYNGGTTELMTGGLEMSKTDLATEISEMITTQRGYQANTRIITVTDSMLEELVNIKR